MQHSTAVQPVDCSVQAADCPDIMIIFASDEQSKATPLSPPAPLMSAHVLSPAETRVKRVKKITKFIVDDVWVGLIKRVDKRS